MRRQILLIVTELRENLFNKIIAGFNRHKRENKNHKDTKIGNEIEKKMNRHKLAFIQLSPFMFLLDKKSDCYDWQQAACFAWYDDIMRMSKAIKFSEHDIDQLLYLKEIVPTVPDSVVKPILQSILVNLLRCVEQESDASTSGAEKITRSRSWFHDLDPARSDQV